MSHFRVESCLIYKKLSVQKPGNSQEFIPKTEFIEKWKWVSPGKVGVDFFTPETFSPLHETQGAFFAVLYERVKIHIPVYPFNSFGIAYGFGNRKLHHIKIVY